MASSLESVGQAQARSLVTAVPQRPAALPPSVSGVVDTVHSQPVYQRESSTQLQDLLARSQHDLVGLQQVRSLLAGVADTSLDEDQSIGSIIGGVLARIQSGDFHTHSLEGLDGASVLNSFPVQGGGLLSAIQNNDIAATQQSVDSIASQILNGVEALHQAIAQAEEGDFVTPAGQNSNIDTERANLLALQTSQQLRLGDASLTTQGVEQILRYFR
ncbi:MAG: hypothetical protein K0U36_02820 [Alphaproteobacteria bacterium]|nr:hypothetical protein [Alphaproteobacteria bacterium]